MTPLALIAAGVFVVCVLALAIVIHIYRHAPLVEPVREDAMEYDND